jgi:uncharacterized protein (TIGR00369 family)
VETGDIDLPRDFLPPPVMRRLGVKIRRAAKGEAEVVATIGGEYGNHDGTLQTGLLLSVMDVAMILAVYSATHDLGITMLDASIQVLRPVQPGTLTAKAQAIRTGKRASFAEAQLLSGDLLSATSRTTWVPGRSAGDF